jgi:chromosome segregation ATPase
MNEKDSLIKDLTNKVKELEKQVKSNTDTVQDHTQMLNNHTQRIEKLEGITSNLQDRMKAIDEKLAVLGDGGLDLSSIQNLMDKFRQECDQRYAQK